MSPKSGYIYAIQLDGTPYVKIGRTTKTPAQRLKVLRRELGHETLTLLAACYIAEDLPQVETAVHQLLEEYSWQGELFHMTLDVGTFEFFVAWGQGEVSARPATATVRKPGVSPNANYAAGRRKSFGDTVHVNEFWGLDPDDLPQVGDYMLLVRRAHELIWVRPSRSKPDTIRYRAIIRRLDEVPSTARTFDSASNLSLRDDL